MPMTRKQLEKLANGDTSFVHNVTCPSDDYSGNKDPEVRERRVVYDALRKNASRSPIEDLLDSYDVGKPFQQAADKQEHLDGIL